jgi:DNA-binding NarL/FixJ family response regulator
MPGTRLILADDHTLFVDALKHLLENEFDIVGTFSDGLRVLESAPALRPKVVLLDTGMPNLNGVTTGQRLKQLLPKVKVIYLADSRDPDLAAAALASGADGYVLKTCAASELVNAIRTVVRGGVYVTQQVLDDADAINVRQFQTHHKTSQLTLRQKQVLQLLAEGRSMKQAAFMLKVSPRTIAFHKYTMMDRLHIRSTAELVQYAFGHHLLAA